MRNVVILLLLSSCDVFYPSVYEVHEDIEPHVQSFRGELINHGHYHPIDNIEAYFSNEVNGASIRWRHETLIMRINPKIWYNENNAHVREAIVYHELAHKILDRRHVDSDSMSIMRESISMYYDYQENKEVYLKELFNTSFY